MKCTCGPYPEIDITSLYYQIINKKQSQSTYETLTAKKVKEACQKFGCFHLILQRPNTPKDDNATTTREPIDLKQNYIQDPFHIFHTSDSTKKQIEELFESPFLQDCFYKDINKNNGNTDSPIQIDGTHILHLNNKDLRSKILSKVTYRGRHAESGDPKSSTDPNESCNNAEPKQSWEMKRCQFEYINPPQTKQKSIISRLSILHEWTQALHSITAFLVHILNLPSILIESNECHCKDNHIHVNQQCNIDLLRVFRYDTIPYSSPHNPILGSSPHTDWGTMTIVWQDDVGGLQMYCPFHDCWKNVPPPSSSTSKDSIHLFVHVGDFLSLTTKSKWPSPRHRVVCPKANGNNIDLALLSRCSLVYFAYPQLCTTLSHVQKEFDSSLSIHDRSNKDTNDSMSFDDLCHYSVLQNQGNQGINDNVIQTYEYIRNMPFEQVIQDKWNQVQRD